MAGLCADSSPMRSSAKGRGVSGFVLLRLMMSPPFLPSLSVPRLPSSKHLIIMIAIPQDGPLSRAFAQAGRPKGQESTLSIRDGHNGRQGNLFAGLLGGNSGGSKLIPIKNGKGEL